MRLHLARFGKTAAACSPAGPCPAQRTDELEFHVHVVFNQQGQFKVAQFNRLRTAWSEVHGRRLPIGANAKREFDVFAAGGAGSLKVSGESGHGRPVVSGQ